MRSLGEWKADYGIDFFDQDPDADELVYQICKTFDDLFLLGRFDIVNDALKQLHPPVDRLSTLMIVTILSQSFCAKTLLDYWPRFLDESWVVLGVREPKRVNSLLKGF